MEKLSQHDSRITDYIKYDANINRDQNIEIGRVTSLGNLDEINVQPGVKLQQFAAEKFMPRLQSRGSNQEGSEYNTTETYSRIAQLAKKQKDIQEGRIPSPPVEYQKFGGDFKLEGRMTQKQYMHTSKQFNKFGYNPYKRPKTEKLKTSPAPT